MSTPARVDVILPAGGRVRGRFAAEVRAEVKALISLHGRTLLERTVKALRATGCVARVVVVGPPELLAHPAARLADAALPAETSGPANILRGLDWLREPGGAAAAERVLIVTSDLPFLTPEAVTGFLAACPPEAEMCVPVIRRNAFEARFPGSPVKYLRLRDGQVIMGCAFLVSPAAMHANRALIERLFAARKHPVVMARLLGLAFILRFLTGRVGVADIEQRCQALTHCRGAAIRDCAPELALDMDRLADYRYALSAA